MPITQARMVSLLSAANSYRKAFDRLRTLAQEELESFTRFNQYDPAVMQSSAYLALQMLCARQLDTKPDRYEEALQAIIIENAHFTPQTIMRNAQVAVNKAAKRPNMRTRATAPQSLADPTVATQITFVQSQHHSREVGHRPMPQPSVTGSAKIEDDWRPTGVVADDVRAQIEAQAIRDAQQMMANEKHLDALRIAAEVDKTDVSLDDGVF